MFLSVDEPEMIVKLITEYPQFKAYYGEIYQLCRNTEKVMEMLGSEQAAGRFGQAAGSD